MVVSKSNQYNHLEYGNVQPQDTLTECFILSKILTGENIGTVALILKADDFYLEKHELIYSACLNIFIEGQNVDLLSCRNELIRLEKLDYIGSIIYLQEIINKNYTPHDIEAMAYFVRDLSIKRKIIRICTEKINESFKDSIYGHQLLSDTLSDIETIQESLSSKSIRDLKSVVNSVTDRIGKEIIIGLPTGINEIDEVTNGIIAPDLITIAAQPGEGKSVLAINLAESMAEAGNAGLFFSLEMKQEQIIERFISRKTGYSVKELRRSEYWCDTDRCLKTIDPNQVKLLSKSIEDLPIHFHDSGLDSYLDIGAIVKAEIVRKKIKWVIIDYLQLIPVPNGKNQSRDVEIGKITRFLKILAMKLNIPIIILSQVNRKANRQRYKLSDLRESGNIEQDSDGVIFIFRPKLHGKDSFELNGQDIDANDLTAILQIEKWRSGEPKDIEVKFFGKTSEFKSITKQFNQSNKSEVDESLPF